MAVKTGFMFSDVDDRKESYLGWIVSVGECEAPQKVSRVDYMVFRGA